MLKYLHIHVLKGISMYKLLFVIMSYLISISAFSAELTPINDDEISGGATCMIMSPQGKVLVDERVKIDGILLDIQKKSVTTNTKIWQGEQMEVRFSLSKGKLLEDKKGGFSVGKGPIGKLSFDYKGIKGTVKAREQCFGAD